MNLREFLEKKVSQTGDRGAESIGNLAAELIPQGVTFDEIWEACVLASEEAKKLFRDAGFVSGKKLSPKERLAHGEILLAVVRHRDKHLTLILEKRHADLGAA